MLLEIDQLTLSTRGTPLLRDIRLSMASGETVALLGESGAGKSLLLWSILRGLPQGVEAAGAIRLHGDDLLRMSVADARQRISKGIGFIPEQPFASFDPRLTIARQFDELRHAFTPASLLRDVGLQEPDRYPHELSGGMLQRAALAFALARGPELILADEPTSALDDDLRFRMLDLLREHVQKRGASLLLVTHRRRDAEHLSARCVRMQEGRLMDA